jgi:hypothetical protein
MIHLPDEMRDILVEQLDDFLESNDEADADLEDLASGVVEVIQSAAAEIDYRQAEDIAALLESSGDLDTSLSDILSEQFDRAYADGMTGEELVSFLEKACEIEWDEDGEGPADTFLEEFAADDEP